MKLIVPVLLLVSLGCASDAPQVVLYCAQDREHANNALQAFKARHQIEVLPKFDTESDKSVSLYVDLVQEKNRPRCDVFWNNEILSTIRLQKQGLLQPYTSPIMNEYPESARASDQTWHAFAARARIILVNRDHIGVGKEPRSLLDLTDSRWKGKVVMAKPHHGTSATQAASLFEVLGKEQAQRYYRELRKNQIHLAPGNRDVAEWVARSQTPSGKPAWLGITDTDDAMGVMQKTSNVAIIIPDATRSSDQRMGTLFIPNTVMMLKTCPHPEQAKKLIDFLLSREMEKSLAEGPSHQIPLNPNVNASLPKALSGLRFAKPMQVDFEKAAEMWEEVQDFLRQEFSR